jgi:hypothetical protein
VLWRHAIHSIVRDICFCLLVLSAKSVHVHLQILSFFKTGAKSFFVDQIIYIIAELAAQARCRSTVAEHSTHNLMIKFEFAPATWLDRKKQVAKHNRNFAFI